MKIAAVICEFNPFHNGHKYLLKQIKEHGYDTIICVMSGSFVQRGEPAIIDKFSRTRVALKNGADLVIELPTPFAVSTAETFAKGGVEIINATGVVDKVFFGSEAGSIELIRKAVSATTDSRVLEVLKAKMNEGEYYPQALEKAVNEIFGNEISDVLKEPNNTLGIEYVKELMKYGIEADTISRIAVAHDSLTASKDFASATFIREKIYNNEDFDSFVPGFDKMNFENPAKLEYGERAVIYKLKTMNTESLSMLPDVTEGLENRLFSSVKESTNLEELLFKIKTKRYTMARLRRIIASAVLNITKDLQSTPVPYLRILGMTDNGKLTLSQISNKTNLPIITSVAQGIKILNEKEKEMLLCDIKATDIRTVFEKHISESSKDFTTAMIKE